MNYVAVFVVVFVVVINCSKWGGGGGEIVCVGGDEIAHFEIFHPQ